MPLPIEDYALIGDTQTCALVGKDGSIDWLCVPRFDSDACFTALLGGDEHGRWLIAPKGGVREVKRRYRPGTLVLETEFVTEDGAVVLSDCMPLREDWPNVVRVVRGVRGRVPMQIELMPRFGYGRMRPWLRHAEGYTYAIAGPDALCLKSDVPMRIEPPALRGEFVLGEGDEASFSIEWQPSFAQRRDPLVPFEALERTEHFWTQWSARCSRGGGRYHDDVVSSLVVLKALTFAPTGGIVAAATTSLPEAIGGVRNWDYRYCWMRDATFTLYALLHAGYQEEAAAFREFLLRATAGDPAQLQIMYGAAGERRLTETELDWLPGYERSRPVRIGNAAVSQFQLDVYGEIMDCLHLARRHGVPSDEDAWTFQQRLLEFVESNWTKADEGIWEVRGGRQHFTHSKMMAWVAVDRAVRAAEEFRMPAPVERWRALRDEIHREVCEKGFNAEKGAFTQAYGSKELDASLLMMTLVGFLPPDDARVRGTVAAIERELMHHGLVRRYHTEHTRDGLPPGEGTFLPCTFWLADNFLLQGREDDARRLFERVRALRNDVGLLSEEYDPVKKRLTGNFPQAFSHVSFVNTAMNLESQVGPARDRRHQHRRNHRHGGHRH